MAPATEKAKAIDKPHLAIWSAGMSLSWSNESGNSTALAAEAAIYAIQNGFDASNSAIGCAPAQRKNSFAAVSKAFSPR